MTCTQCSGSGTWITGSSKLMDGEWKFTPNAAPQCPLCDGTGEQRRIWPFSSGMEFAGWTKDNCHKCALSYDGDDRGWRCDIERALANAYVGHGTMPIDIARRAGLDGMHAGDCKEKVSGD